MGVSMRHRFPIFSSEENHSLIYFDSAATSQKPEEVLRAMNDFLQEEYGTVHRAIYRLSAWSTQRYDEVRHEVQQLIGARSFREIIFTGGTTDGINLVAFSYGEAYICEGDEILVLETEHHANIVPWHMLCQRKKAFLRVIPVDDGGEVNLQQFASMLSDKVKLVAIAHVANATGAIHPIAQVVALAHRYGAKVLVDAAQSIAHMPLSVVDLDVDFLVFSGHKMYGPTGIGVLYGKEELLEQMPPYQGGGDMIDKVGFDRITYQKPPLKFEAGTPNIVSVIGLGAAIRFLQEVGLDYIAQHEHDLMQRAISRLQSVPNLRFLAKPRRHSSLLSFQCGDCHPLDVGSLLDTRNIAVRTGNLCAQPTMKRFGVSATIRISFGIYNTKEEIDLFADVLQEVVQLLS